MMYGNRSLIYMQLFNVSFVECEITAWVAAKFFIMFRCNGVY
jgi:hypothetical protein